MRCSSHEMNLIDVNQSTATPIAVSKQTPNSALKQSEPVDNSSQLNEIISQISLQSQSSLPAPSNLRTTFP
jgi:hypothetical protein